MPAWEYKYVTSGKGGFATPALMESFLNQLGQEEWEILYVQPHADNPLAFSGLARRPTQREWTLENAVTAAARAEADKLRAEFEAKFRGTGGSAAETEEPAPAPAGEPEPAGGEIRKLRDTERDLDPELADEEEGDEWDKIANEDELPTFFEAIQPLMRRNQRGEGVAVGVEHLAKKWNLGINDVVAALKECGFVLPEDEDTPPAYLEYDGDFFWVNMNRRGELWINSREKPRPRFRVAPGRPVANEPVADQPAPASSAAEPAEAPQSRAEKPDLPEGVELLERIRPLMRRDRSGTGLSGSTGFLARALKCREKDLVSALEALGLRLDGRGGTAAPVELGGGSWSMNRDRRGGIWINEREPGAIAAPVAAGEAVPAEASIGSAPADSEAPVANPALAAARLLLKPTRTGAVGRLLLKSSRTGAVAGEIGQLAETVGKSRDEFLAALLAAGLTAPEKPREKPVFVEQGGEIFWLNKNSKDELWLNAKESKFADGGERQPRSRPD